VKLLLSERPERALMAPKQPHLALWIALVSCVLALVAHLLGASTPWTFQLFMFAFIITVAEWVYGEE
jgi:formate-dependent nitrite reductase membrane component NrfD